MAGFEQVSVQWVEGSLILVATAITAIKTFLSHDVKLHDVKNMCNYKGLLLCQIHWYIEYLTEKIYNDYNNVVLFWNFYQLSGIDANFFQNFTLNVKRFQ